jgi:phosphoglycerate kinase
METAMAWKTLDDMELGGRIVLTRVDINVPMERGRVTDATRIERIVPTVKDILAKGGKPVLWRISGGPRGSRCRRCRSATWCPRWRTRWGSP